MPQRYEVVKVGGDPLGVGKVLSIEGPTRTHEMVCNCVSYKAKDAPKELAHMQLIADALNAYVAQPKGLQLQRRRRRNR